MTKRNTKSKVDTAVIETLEPRVLYSADTLFDLAGTDDAGSDVLNNEYLLHNNSGSGFDASGTFVAPQDVVEEVSSTQASVIPTADIQRASETSLPPFNTNVVSNPIDESNKLETTEPAAPAPEVDSDSETADSYALVPEAEYLEHPVEYVFVDPSFNTYSPQLANLKEISDPETQWRVLVLDADADGLSQITESLSEVAGVDAIHLFTGTTGEAITFGSSVLNADNSADYAIDLWAWGQSLQGGASMHVYGAAASDSGAGRELVKLLRDGCDCDVVVGDVPGDVRRELVLVDAATEDLDLLVNDLLNNDDPGRIIEYAPLYPNLGIDQIEDILQTYSGLGAVHIVTHGNHGEVQIGNTWLSNAQLTTYSDEIASWGDALTSDGDLVFYGCNLAATEQGRELLSAIAELCDCDVAASDDVTGHETLGGDWQLEYSDGVVQTESLLSLDAKEAWRHTLPVAAGIASTASGGFSLNTDGGNNANLVVSSDGSAGSIGDVLGGITDMTIEFDFLAADTGLQTLLSYGATQANDLVVQIDTNASGVGFLTVMLNGAIQQTDAAAVDYSFLLDGSRHQLAFNWNSSGEWSVYTDGQHQETGAGFAVGDSIAGDANTGWLMFGQEQSVPGGGYQAANTFRGTYYDVRIFSEERSGDEIAANYRTDLPFDEPNMVANWRFQDISTNGIVTDAVNGNNLLLTAVAVGGGFTTNDPQLSIDVDENTVTGTVVGTVVGVDTERNALVSDVIAAAASEAPTRTVIFSAETGKFYELVSNWVTWSQAADGAAATNLNGVGGQLVQIHSATENQLVVDFLNTEGVNHAFIGAHDSFSEGDWHWHNANTGGQFWIGDENGSNIDGGFENWPPTDPNDNAGTQDFAKVLAPGGLWDDVEATNISTYIVEYNANAVLSNNGAIGSQPLTYSIQNQSVAGAFSIDAGTGVISVANGSLLDYESAANHSIAILIEDIDGNIHSKTVTVELSDIVDAGMPPAKISSGIEINADGGNDSYLRATDGGSLLGGLSSLTFEVRFALLPKDINFVLASYESSAGSDRFQVEIRTNGELSVSINGSTFTTDLSDDYNYHEHFTDGGIHSLAITWESNSGGLAVFVDGEHVESGSGFASGQTINGIAGDGSLVFGQTLDSAGVGFTADRVFSGTYYDARIWDTIRTKNQIGSNYNAKLELTRSEALAIGLQANWQMQLNGGNEVIDIVSESEPVRNPLGVYHAGDSLFAASTPANDLHIGESASNGTSVGFVLASEKNGFTDIVKDGRFLSAPDPGGYAQYSEGNVFGDWTVRSGTVDLHGTFMELSPLGGRSVDLNGSATGGIYQTINTEIGKRYQVIFETTGHWLGPEKIKDIRVSAGGISKDFSLREPDGWSVNNLLWMPKSLSFTANSQTAELDFRSLDTSYTTGPIISDVQVLEVPDEISTILNNNPLLSYDMSTGKFYRYVEAPANFNTALSDALGSSINGHKGRLLTIDSHYENEIFTDLAIDSGSEIWLGAFRSNVTGSWGWMDGSVEGETFWTGGSGGGPSVGEYASSLGLSAMPDENRLRLAEDGNWHDIPDSATMNYVIEWDATEVLSTFTYVLTNDANGRFAIDSDTGEISVADNTQFDAVTNPTHTLSVAVVDSAGLTYEEQFLTVTIDRSLELVQTIPAVQVFDENSVLTFNSANSNLVTVSDSLSGPDALLQVELSVDYGILNLNGLTASMLVAGADGSGSVTIEGDETQLNAVLDGMTFTPDPNFNGAVELTMMTSLSAGLASQYTFDGGDGNSQSAGTTAPAGVVQGGATLMGDQLNLSALGQSFEIPGIDVENSPDVTLAAWVNVSSVGSGGGDLISLGDTVGLRIDNVGTGVNGFFYNGTGWDAVHSRTFIAGTGWHHVAYTVDDANKVQRIYIDGNLLGETYHTSAIEYAGLGSNTIIGRHGDGQATFDVVGLVDDVRIYSRSVTSDEIVALSAGQISVLDTMDITVTAVNTAPTVATNTGITITEGGTGIITNAMLNEGDFDDDGADVIYQLRADFTPGALWLNGTELAPGDTFTQADIDADRVSVRGSGGGISFSPLSLTIMDGGENSASPTDFDFQVNFNYSNDNPAAADDPAGTPIAIAADADVVGFWKLGESGGNTAIDESGSNNGTYSNVTLGATGISGADTAVRFNGSTSYVDLGNLNVNGSGITMAAWINADSFNYTDGRIISKADGVSTQSHTFMLSTNMSGGEIYLRMRVEAGGYTDMLHANSAHVPPLVIGQWHHVAATYDEASGTMAMYLDGKQVALAQHDNGGPVDQNMLRNVWIGANPTGVNYFDGSIDEVVLLQRAMSVSEIASLAEISASDYETTETAVLNVNATDGLLRNDSDANGDPLTVTAVNGGSANLGNQISIGQGGILTVNTDGSFEFDSNGQYGGLTAGETHSEVFNYTVSDGKSGFSTAVATIVISGENTAPVMLGINELVNSSFDTDLIHWNASGDIDWFGGQARFGAVGGTGGEVFQSTNTVVGETYYLKFDFGDDSTSEDLSINVRVDGASTLLDANIVTSVTSDGLEPYTYRFIADSTLTKLTFTDTTPDHAGATARLDNVEIRSDIPALSSLNYTEGDPALTVHDLVAVADLDDELINSARVQIVNYELGEDVLAAVGMFGITPVWNHSAGWIDFTGAASVAHYETMLRSVTYQNNNESPTESTRTIVFVVNDGDSSSSVLSRNIIVSASNDAPVLDSSATLVLPAQMEDSGAPVAGSVVGSTLIEDLVQLGVNVADVDTAAQTGVAIVGADTNLGIWHYTTDNGVSWNALGIVSETNALLLQADGSSRVHFEPAADVNGDISSALTIRAWDRTEGSNGGYQAINNGGGNAFSTETDTIALSITAENDAPVLDNSGDMRLADITEDEVGDIGHSVEQIVASGGGDRITDVDSGAVEGIAIISQTSANGDFEYRIGGGIWTPVDVVGDDSALLLDSQDRIRFVPDEVNGTLMDAVIEFRAWDKTQGIAGTRVDVAGNGGLTAFSAETEIATAKSTPVNDAPVLDSSATLVLPAQMEDSGAPVAGSTVGSTSIEDLVQLGVNVADVDTGAQTGVAIVGADTSIGIWHFSTDNGVSWNALGIVSETNALLLPADGSTRVHFEPAADVNGDISSALTIRAWDRTEGSNGSYQAISSGGSNAFSTETDTIALSITPENDAPVLDDTETTDLSYIENQGAAAITEAITLADLDSTFIDGAIIAISPVYSSGEDKLDSPGTSNISVSWNDASGSLLLTGPADRFEFEQALKDVTYTNLADHPSGAVRTITFQVFDGEAYSNIVSRNISVTAVNDSPQNQGGFPGTVVTDEDTKAIIDLGLITLADPDAANDDLTVTISTALGGVLEHVNTQALTANGTFTDSIQLSGTLANLNTWFGGSGNLLYTPLLNANGIASDTIEIRVSDNGNNGAGASPDVVLGTIQVDITAVNDEPFGADLAIDIDEEQTYFFSASDFGFSDTIDDHNFESVYLEQLPAKGLLELPGTNLSDSSLVAVSDLHQLQYSPDVNGNGQAFDTLVFRVQDDGGSYGLNRDSTANTITFNVASINDAPVGQDLLINTAEDTSIAIELNDFGFSDVSDAGVLKSVVIVSAPLNGKLVLNNNPVFDGQLLLADDIRDGDLRYEPGSQRFGLPLDQIEFRVVDDGGLPGNDTALLSNLLTINVTGVNDPREGTGNSVTTDEDQPYFFTETDFGFFDTNDSSDTLSGVLISTVPNKGQLMAGNDEVEAGDVISTASIAARELAYISEADGFGNDYAAFRFQVQDNNPQPGQNTDVTPREMSIDVTQVSDAPTGQNLNRVTPEDTDMVISLQNFGFDDTKDGDNPELVFIDRFPESGKLLLNEGGIFVPLTDSTIEVSDITAGKLIYRPEADYYGEQQLVFRLQDSGTSPDNQTGILHNSSISANTLDLSITSVSDAPSGEDKVVEIIEDTLYPFTMNDFGFSDQLDSRNNHEFTGITISSPPESGFLALRGVQILINQFVSADDIAGGHLTYLPPENITGAGYRGFEFQVHDSGESINGGLNIDQSSNLITFDFPGVNDAPKLISTGATVLEGGRIVINSTMLYGTDADDPEPHELAITITRLPDHGVLEINGQSVQPGDQFTLQSIFNESLRYHHDGSETSSDSFSVLLADGGENNTAAVPGDFILEVTEVEDPAPDIAGDELALKFGDSFDSLNGDLLASGYSLLNLQGFDTNRYTVEIIEDVQHGVAVINQNGTFTYVHDRSDFLVDSFVYRVTNEDGNSTVATVNITIAPPIQAASAQQERHELDSSNEGFSAKETDAAVEPIEETAVSFVPLFGEAVAAAIEGDAEHQQSSEPVNLGNVVVDDGKGWLTSAEDNAIGVNKHKRVETGASSHTIVGVSQATVDLILEVDVRSARETVGNESFLQGLDRLNDDLDNADTESARRYQLVGDSAFGLSISMTAGAMIWALRGGALFGSLMTLTPLWASMDITRVGVSAGRDEDSESQDSTEVEKMFDTEK